METRQCRLMAVVLALLAASIAIVGFLPTASAEIDNDQGTVTYYTYTVDFQFQGTDAEWISWDFGFKNSDGSKATSSEWNPKNVTYPSKGSYDVIQVVGNTVGTFTSKLTVVIMGTPEVSFVTSTDEKIPMQTVKVGSCATEPKSPVREGYTFGGWYKESSCLNAYDFKQPVTEHITLYAKWIANSPGPQPTPDQPEEKEDTESVNVIKIGDIELKNQFFFLVLIALGAIVIYFGVREENQPLTYFGVALASLGFVLLVFDVDAIGFFMNGGKS